MVLGNDAETLENCKMVLTQHWHRMCVTGSGVVSSDNGPCGQTKCRFHTPAWVPTAGAASALRPEPRYTASWGGGGEGGNLSAPPRGQGVGVRPVGCRHTHIALAKAVLLAWFLASLTSTLPKHLLGTELALGQRRMQHLSQYLPGNSCECSIHRSLFKFTGDCC